MNQDSSTSRSAIPLVVGFLACTAVVTLLLVAWSLVAQYRFSARLDAFQAQFDQMSIETTKITEKWRSVAQIAGTQLELEQKASESRDSIDKKLEELKADISGQIVDVSRSGLMYRLGYDKRQEQLLADLEALSNTLKASGIKWYHGPFK